MINVYKTSYEKRIKWIIIFVLTIIYFMRVFFLDADVKSFLLAQVQPVDELYYNELAVKIYRYGISNIINGTWSQPSVANARTFLLPNLLVALSLKIIGNNYYGLKIPYVLMGYVVGIFLYKCAKEMAKSYKEIIFFVMMLYIFDFNVFMLSREAVTVLPCMLGCIVYLYGMLKIKSEKIKYFFGGFWPIISFCLIYMGLPFIIASSCVYFLSTIIKREGNEKNKIFFYFLGICFGIVLCELCSLLFFQQHVTKTIIDTFAAHGGKIDGLTVFRSVSTFFNYTLGYWGSNAFRYNYLVLFFGLLAFIVCIYKSIKKDKNAFLLITLIGFHWAQTIFLNNMTPSKATITYPVILIAITYSFVFFKDNIYKIVNVKFICTIILLTIMLFAIFIMILSHKISPLVLYDKYLLYMVSVSITLSLFAFYINQNKKILFYVSFLVTLFFMSYLSVKYVFVNRTYYSVEMMKDIGRITDNGAIINGKGFALYNLCEAPVCSYDHYKGVGYDKSTVEEEIRGAVYEYDKLYFIRGGSIDGINSQLADTPYEFIKLKEYIFEYQDSFEQADRLVRTLYIKVRKENSTTTG